jgi:hypothetical protein
METDSEDRKMTRKIWPSKKPLPRFANEAEELAFWEAYDVPWSDQAEGEEVRGPAVSLAAKRPRTLKVTLPASQEALLDRLAKQQHMSKEQALEAIIGDALRPARPQRRKRAASA